MKGHADFRYMTGVKTSQKAKKLVLETMNCKRVENDYLEIVDNIYCNFGYKAMHDFIENGYFIFNKMMYCFLAGKNRIGNAQGMHIIPFRGV